MVETSPPTQAEKSNRGSQRLFIVIGLLWLVLGAIIVMQLPQTVPTFITVTWTTETETDTAGFNIYRAEREGSECTGIDDAAYTQVNDQLIGSSGSVTEGDSYRYEDSSIERDKKYCYQLEDIELGGTKEKHPPIKGEAPRQIDRILYLILAPLSLIVGLSLIVSGFKGERI